MEKGMKSDSGVEAILRSPKVTLKRVISGAAFILLAGCTASGGAAVLGDTSPHSSPLQAASVGLPAISRPAASASARTEAFPRLRPARWDQLPGWGEDDLVEAWPAWLQSCATLGRKDLWSSVCAESALVDSSDPQLIREYYQRNFQPFEVSNPDNTLEGLVTGYYEPVIRGDRTRTDRARFPVYGLPPDLVSVELEGLFSDLKFRRLRGRLVEGKVVPYFTRQQIESENSGFSGEPIAWAEDQVDLFYLQIQGSGRIAFPDGETMRIGYAGQNGHPFRSVARSLIDEGELTESQASPEGIKEWGKRNPDRLQEVLFRNPSYVFFRELTEDNPGPVGSLGVPLTDRRSIAVDPQFIPLGAPVFLSTTWPLSDRPLNRLMLAQDTGGAIRGAVRVDFFWGWGDEAGKNAGRMKQAGRKWVLLPREFTR